MSDDSGGYVRIYRSILENPTFRNAEEAMFFAYLVLKANWRSGERRYDDRVYRLDRGEMVIGTRKLAKEFGWSHKKVRTLIKRLIDWKMVGTKWAQHGAQRAPGRWSLLQSTVMRKSWQTPVPEKTRKPWTSMKTACESSAPFRCACHL